MHIFLGKVSFYKPGEESYFNRDDFFSETQTKVNNEEQVADCYWPEIAKKFLFLFSLYDYFSQEISLL